MRLFLSYGGLWLCLWLTRTSFYHHQQQQTNEEKKQRCACVFPKWSEPMNIIVTWRHHYLYWRSSCCCCSAPLFMCRFKRELHVHKSNQHSRRSDISGWLRSEKKNSRAKKFIFHVTFLYVFSASPRLLLVHVSPIDILCLGKSI